MLPDGSFTWNNTLVIRCLALAIFFSAHVGVAHAALPLKCYLFIFGDALHVNRLPITNLLAGAKYIPMNPPVDLMINPLIKPKHDTQDVDESLVSAYC
jgi:hypothetical protein